MTKELLSERLQVLLSFDDLHSLDMINARISSANKTRILPMSVFMRNILKDYIKHNTPE